jgi:ClpX C4-type zinc finger protein
LHRSKNNNNKKRTPLKPPPALAYSRVLHYVRIDKSIAYRGRTLVTVDGRELGRVSCLAICDQQKGHILLFHCNRNWRVLGCSGHDSVAAAKKKAEWIYPGLAKHWKPAHITKTQARKFLEKIWGKMFCSFCGRRPHELAGLFGNRSPYICGDCVEKFHARLQEPANADSGAECQPLAGPVPTN